MKYKIDPSPKKKINFNVKDHIEDSIKGPQPVRDTGRSDRRVESLLGTIVDLFDLFRKK